MGLHSGSVSFVRYRVLGLKKSFKLVDLNAHLAPYQAKRLRLQGTHKEESYGWVRPLGIAESDEEENNPEWDMADCRFEDGFLLRFRLDRRKVPPALLQILVKERVRKKNASRQKPLSHRERKQLLEDTKLELLAGCLPSISFEDSYWQPESGQLFLFSSGKKAQQIFEELFYKTFCEHLGLTLIKQDPPLIGLADNEWSDIDRLSDFVQNVSTSVPATLAENRH